jgi:hypothetical protein
VAAVQTTADGKPRKVCFQAMRFTQAEMGIGHDIPWHLTPKSTAMLCRA